jgi:polysaccharide deacetylase 2 family uncharacterized protein YibQ
MKKNSLTKIFILFLIVFIILISIKQGWLKKSAILPKKAFNYLTAKKDTSTSPKQSNNLEPNILRKLDELEVKSDEIEINHFLENNQKEIKAAIPLGKPVEWVIWQLSQAAKGTPYEVTDCFLNKKKARFIITYTPQNPKQEKVILIFSNSKRYLSNAALVAILVEDFEFQANKTTIDFLSFPEPLTISLLPFIEKNSWTAQAANEYKKEIVIHLPFEPKISKRKIPTSSIIMIHYPEKEIRKIINNSTKTIPNFRGFANLYGSIAVEDSRVMKIVLNEIKKHQGYFINTYGGRNSVVPRVAEKIKIDYKEISTVIKDKSTAVEIDKQLKHFIDIARKKGSIIITAKASEALTKVLNSVLPYTKQYGVKFVYISDIVNK